MASRSATPTPGYLRPLIAGLLAGAWTGVLVGLFGRPASPTR
jgi:hypothetical protein